MNETDKKDDKCNQEEIVYMPIEYIQTINCVIDNLGQAQDEFCKVANQLKVEN